jgi:hypothetical protein
LSDEIAETTATPGFPETAPDVAQLASRILNEDYTAGEAAILGELARIETKVDAMLAVFEQLSGVLEQLQGKSLLDVFRGR